MRLYIVLFVVFSTKFLSTSAQCQIYDFFAIRNQPSGLVLEAVDEDVTLQQFTGDDAQLWRFECAGPPGVYNIFSKRLYVAFVLDVQTSDNTTHVFLNIVKDTKSNTQKWFINFDGTIANLDSQLFLDVLSDDGKPAVGNRLGVVALSGKDTQKFLLQPKT